MDRIRLTGFQIRTACDRLQNEINAILAEDITDPVQRKSTIEKVIELQAQLAVWLAIAHGQLPVPKAANATPAPAPRPPLQQRSPTSTPPIQTHK